MILRSRLVFLLVLLAGALAVFNLQYHKTSGGGRTKFVVNAGAGQSRKVLLSKLKKDLEEVASGDKVPEDNLPDDFEVPGWGKHVNRDVAAYVKGGVDTALIKPNLSSQDSLSATTPRLLIAVISAPGNFALRQMVRNNQATACDHSSIHFNLANCDYFFILGRTSKKDLSEKVRREAEKYGDILVEDFADSYNNLTLKSLHMIKFFLQKEQYTHLVKVDDDCFFNPYVLQSRVRQQLQLQDDFLMGHYVPPQHPSRDINLLNTSYFGKFLAPRYIYQGDFYPGYMATLYVMSRSAAECIFTEAFNEPVFFIEDIYITGILSLKCQNILKVSDHDAFLIRSPPRTAVRFDTGITAAAHLAFQNDYLVSEMPKMWDRIRRSMAANAMKQQQQQQKQQNIMTENSKGEQTEYDESDF